MSIDVQVRVAERDKVRQVAASLAKAFYDSVLGRLCAMNVRLRRPTQRQSADRPS